MTDQTTGPKVTNAILSQRGRSLRNVACAFVVAVGWAAPGVAQDLGDADRGARVFKKCMACHRVGPEATSRVGPHLNDLIGRVPGTLDGFRYSKALTTAGEGGLVWQVETLDPFIANPKSTIPGTRMTFRGISDPADRADLLAYLVTFSESANETAAGSGDAPAVDAAVLAIKGDPEYGAYLSSECTTCHQADGGDKGIPAIVGWPAEDFVIVMHAYKTKARDHPVMTMIAGRLGDEEIAALAAYFENSEN